MKIRLLSFLIFFSVMPLFAQTAYTTSLKTVIYSEPSLGSEKVAQLTQGTAITINKTHGKWVYISSASKNGWIQKAFTSTVKPKGKVSILGNANRTSRMKARERASSDVTAASARGFMQTENSKGRSRPNQEALKFDPADIDKMESVTLSEDELITFLRQGGLLD
ncbi:MAG TPA: hypothetical protein P5123_02900 [Spirochaetota bacterium]|nr:hypothetical protein [Spirochaetota bacterium]